MSLRTSGRNRDLRSHKFAGHSAVVNKSLKEQHQRPEGRLIEAAMKSPKLSGRKLAELVGLSEGRIRQILNGYKSEGGQLIPIIGPADTVARMAEAVGVSAKEMREAGREDVAAEMTPLRSIGLTEDGGLWLSDTNDRLAELRRWMDDPEGADAGQPPPIGPLSLWDFEQLLEAVLVKHQDEIRLKDYFIEMFGRKQTSYPVANDPYSSGGDGDADDTRGSAPIDAAAEAAHDEEHTIESEQEVDTTP